MKGVILMKIVISSTPFEIEKPLTPSRCTLSLFLPHHCWIVMASLILQQKIVKIISPILLKWPGLFQTKKEKKEKKKKKKTENIEICTHSYSLMKSTSQTRIIKLTYVKYGIKLLFNQAYLLCPSCDCFYLRFCREFEFCC